MTLPKLSPVAGKDVSVALMDPGSEKDPYLGFLTTMAAAAPAAAAAGPTSALKPSSTLIRQIDKTTDKVGSISSCAPLCHSSPNLAMMREPDGESSLLQIPEGW